MLTGTLDDFRLHDIFRLISNAEKTGCLSVSTHGAVGRVFFRSGDIYYAESSRSREGFGRKLIRMGALTDKQLKRTLDHSASDGEPLGSMLVDKGLVTSEELETALCDESEDALLSFFSWEQGSFSFEADIEIQEETPIPMPVEDVIARLSQRLDDLANAKKTVPEDAVPAPVRTPPRDAQEMTISADEWAVLATIDGARTVKEIIEHEDLGHLDAFSVLQRLLASGVIEMRNGDNTEADVIDLRDEEGADRRAGPPSPPPSSVLGERG